jgi:hypothetical protein
MAPEREGKQERRQKRRGRSELPSSVAVTPSSVGCLSLKSNLRREEPGGIESDGLCSFVLGPHVSLSRPDEPFGYWIFFLNHAKDLRVFFLLRREVLVQPG